MLTATTLLRDGKAIPEALAATIAAAPAPASVADAMASAEGDLLAALCLITAAADRAAAAPLVPAVLKALGADGWAGKAAAFAAARLVPVATIAAVIPDGGLDERENAYAALAGHIALGGGSVGLADQLAGFISAEIDRAKGGRTSLAEHALRALAVLGDPRVAEFAQQIIEADRFCDRFEVNRLRKAASDGKDRETRSALLAPWNEQFADHLAKPPVVAAPAPAPAAAKAPVAKPAATRSPLAPPTRPAPRPPVAPAPVAEVPAAADDGEPLDGETLDGEAAAPKGLDWQAFAESPQAAALKPSERQMVVQVGPLLEELAARAIGIPLTECTGEEVMALMLQVLPQALPPQHVQAVLSPQSLNGIQAVGAWLGEGGANLIAGIKLIRTQMQAQMRRAGIISGPDYSQPG